MMIRRKLALVLICSCFASSAMASCFTTLEDAKVPDLLREDQNCIAGLRGSAGPRVKSVTCQEEGMVTNPTVYTFDRAGRVHQVNVDLGCLEQHTFEYAKGSVYPIREITTYDARDASLKYCQSQKPSTHSFEPDSRGYPRTVASQYPGERPGVMLNYEWSTSLVGNRVTETTHNPNVKTTDTCVFQDGWLQSCETSMPLISLPGSAQAPAEPMHILCNYSNRQKNGWSQITQIQVEAGKSSIAYREAYDANGRPIQAWNMPGSSWNGKATGSTDTFRYPDTDTAGHWTTRITCTTFESDPQNPPRCVTTHRAIVYW